MEADRTNTDDIIAADDANTDKVTGAIEKHGNFIIEGLKSLFIPSDDYFKTWFDGMYQFFNDRLGFLMLPVDLLVRMADMYASAGTASAGIPFPEFKWVDGTVIIPGQVVQLDVYKRQVYSNVGDLYPSMNGGVYTYAVYACLFVLVLTLLFNLVHAFFFVGRYRI